MGIIELFSKKKAKEMQKPPLPGSIVRSTSGRDEGAYYIITEQFDNIYVAVADGKYRSVSRPKRKNVRHVALTGQRIPDKYTVRGKIVITDGEAVAILAGITDPINT
jgi:ribosomal protein L14E/L6E/L27E